MKHHRGLEGGDAQVAHQVPRVLAQRRHQHQQRHHGQILEEQDARDPPAMFAFQLQPLGHHL